MTILNHPRIDGVVVDVPESDVDRWVAQGWVSGGAVGRATEVFAPVGEVSFGDGPVAVEELDDFLEPKPRRRKK